MTERYSDEKYIIAKSLIQKRQNILSEVYKISAEIERLTKLREATRTEARRLKSAAIAYDIGVSKSWVDKVAEGKVVR